MRIVKLSELEGMAFPTGRVTRVLTGRDLLPTQNFTAGYVVIRPGGTIPPHTHSNEEIYILVKGRAKLVVASEETTVEAVSGVYIEPDSEHALENVGEEDAIMIFVYSPAGVVDHWAHEMEAGSGGKRDG
ncbi:MAG: cupin domain-containing protein [Deltaproteobacteria bacterium]|nr:cupin domain-containing protein [Deltaproteobacteria bacterium]MBW2120913.1 cupin domain-containing protein [Deltaproteobacteria bacterium]